MLQPPSGSHPRSVIDVPAVAEPHQGSSYNPPVSAHQELLRTAHEIEEQRVKSAEYHKIIRDKVAAARHVVNDEIDNGMPTGMTLDPLEEDPEMEEQGDGVRVSKPQPERKTKQQRRKAEKQRAEKRALAEKLAKKRLLTSVATAKALRKSLDQSASARECARAQKQLMLKEKLKRGMAGSKLGKHIVKEGDIDVQLGEDLSESLRALKVSVPFGSLLFSTRLQPEGNLFRDRFISMQHRALVEPRAPVL
jgi:nucleolar protein 53